MRYVYEVCFVCQGKRISTQDQNNRTDSNGEICPPCSVRFSAQLVIRWTSQPPSLKLNGDNDDDEFLTCEAFSLDVSTPITEAQWGQ